MCESDFTRAIGPVDTFIFLGLFSRFSMDPTKYQLQNHFMIDQSSNMQIRMVEFLLPCMFDCYLVIPKFTYINLMILMVVIVYARCVIYLRTIDSLWWFF